MHRPGFGRTLLMTCLGLVCAGGAVGQEGNLPSPEPATSSSVTDDDRDLSMNLRSPGPLRRTEATLGDWRDVNEQGGVSELLRRHWVQLGPDRLLRGRVSTLDDGRLDPSEELDVSFLQEGRVVARTQTDSGGRFVAEGLSPGVYCLIARGRNGFLAYSINVVGPRGAGQAARQSPSLVQLVQLGRVRGQLEIDSVAVPPTFRTVKNLIERYNLLDTDNSRLLPDVPQDDADDQGAAAQAPPAAPEPAQADLETQANLAAAAATTIKQHVVYLTPDGRLIGKLTSIDFDSGRPKSVEDVTVHIIRNDRSIANAAVRRNGVFEIEDLEPGSYSLVATGRGGFGAIGFELLARERQARLDDSIQLAVDRGDRTIQLAQAGNNTPFPISIALIDDPRNLRAAMRPAPAAPAGQGAAGGMAGGPGGGGFGAAAGTGGFGGGSVGSGLGAALLGAGGLAAGITALAERNNDQPENDLVSNFMPTVTPVVIETPVEEGGGGEE